MDFDKCHNLSKRNVKPILKILNDLEPKGLLEQKNVVFNVKRFTRVLNWPTHAKKKTNLHTNSLNKLLGPADLLLKEILENSFSSIQN
jgi:hypothetical protein